MSKRGSVVGVLAAACIATVTAVGGCLNVQTPREINIGSSPGRRAIDTRSLPATRSHEEAREKLAEAYERIRYLEGKIRHLEADKREIKQERDEYKRKYKREKDRHDD